MNDAPHTPVLMKEVLHHLNPREGGVYVDATFGAGGYTQAILSACLCKVVALDRDPAVQPLVEKVSSRFSGRFEFIQGRFGDMVKLLEARGIKHIDGIVFDIGVSSMQIDEAERGFSFQKMGPLDMRMSQEGPTLAERLQDIPEAELADILYVYGEEKKSRRIAKFIVEARTLQPITTTLELASIVRRAVPQGGSKIDPATRTFQALRIWMNRELEELEQGLAAAKELLKPDGRLVVVVFHSLEDRIVKQFLTEESGKTNGISRHIPLVAERKVESSFKLLTKKPVMAGEEETRSNPRARSAKLRAAIRTPDTERTAA